MENVGIFIYGLVVTAIVASALALIAWGIVNERRDRKDPGRRREMFGAPASAAIARQESRPDEGA